MKSIPGPWLMTLNDSPEARELYSGCPMVSISRNLSTENRRGRSVNRTYRELIIANYDLEAVRKQNRTKGQQQLWTD